jgi:2-polyprenyl-3-methyl-5-hydroxy-6-metoxy-1,4-benzoquinol methylase
MSTGHFNNVAEESFLRGGYARVNFHESRSWKECYDRLHSVSRRFVSTAWRDGAKGYTWPLDPLNNWSRVWEYPFVANQLRRNGCEDRGLRLLDVGAAVTFFPYYLIQQGFQVTNLDADASMPAHFERAFQTVRKKFNIEDRPEYLIADARDTRLPAESFDVVTCISVLEHIPEWDRAIGEISRLLAAGGLCILTFDVQHGGPADALSAQDCRRLFHQLDQHMALVTSIEQSIPVDALTPFNATWRPRITKHRPLWRRLWPITAWPRKFVNRARRMRLSDRPEDICIFGGVWRKH